MPLFMVSSIYTSKDLNLNKHVQFTSAENEGMKERTNKWQRETRLVTALLGLQKQVLHSPEAVLKQQYEEKEKNNTKVLLFLSKDQGKLVHNMSHDFFFHFYNNRLPATFH